MQRPCTRCAPHVWRLETDDQDALARCCISAEFLQGDMEAQLEKLVTKHRNAGNALFAEQKVCTPRLSLAVSAPSCSSIHFAGPNTHPSTHSPIKSTPTPSTSHTPW